MKKIFLLLMLFASSCAMSQTPYKVFCEILGTGKLLSTKVSVMVDFGQKTSIYNTYKQKLVDDNGKSIEFNSMVDAMNYMAKSGWVFEQAYYVTVNGQNVIHWLLSKEVTSDEEIKDGFITKQEYEKINKKD